ncbi:MAG: hypothetical protein WC508_00280 [Patescibacteria group bacterium]
MTKFSHLAKPTMKNYSAQKKLSGFKLSFPLINGIVAVCCIVFFVTYLIQVNSLATKGYQIKELEKKISDLEQQKADLDLQTLSLQSVGALKDKVGSLGMVAVGKTDYLADKPVALAQ